MMDIDLSQYMGMYVDGSRENLDLMDKHLLALEQDTDNIEAVGEIFRAAHTLKGMSATMGFEKVAHLTHEMENVLDKFRNHTVAVTPEIIDILFETFDCLRTLVNDSIDSTDSNVDLEGISAKLAECVSGNSSEKTSPKPVSAPSVSANKAFDSGI
ncbi:MAG: Hpt domain-containing protein, partial [Candidatus Riflebacteria bacterium]|nr:Hpt domain-containing protein [Candidatus Riflebacteria bacterium]